ncbi:MAG: phenylalanine 4-monooxygenase [Dongiaceae bacterium]
MAYTHTAVKTPEQFTAAQDWNAYTEDDHGVWKFLYERQTKLVAMRACAEYLDGVKQLQLSPDRLPDYRRLNDFMYKSTGWQIAVVPCFIPPELFFELLAKRHFPATAWIRSKDNLDYLPEPDMFHDVFGHMPMLMDPVYSDYVHEYGKAAVREVASGHMAELQRIYWFTIEFGLINSATGPKIYGSGILSSKGESVYCLDDPTSHQIRFNLKRVMRTTYRIDEYQKTYFVIDSFKQLFDDTMADFKPIYAELKNKPTIPWTEIDKDDEIIRRGTCEGEPDTTQEDPTLLMERLNQTRKEREKKSSS